VNGEPVDAAAHHPPSEPPSPGPARRVLQAPLAWGLSIALVAGLTVGVMVAAKPASSADLLDRINPDTPGTTWVFAATNLGEDMGTHTVRIVGDALFGSGTVTLSRSEYSDFLGQGPSSSHLYVGRRGSESLAYGNRSLAHFESYDPPQPLLRMPLRPGQTWSWSGKQGDKDASFRASVVGVETVEVLGRPVRGCVHTRIDSHLLSGGQDLVEHDDSWGCPGYGTVRLRSAGPGGGTLAAFDVRQELVSFHTPGLNLGPAAGTGTDPHGLGARLGTGLGIDPGRTGYVPGARLDPSRFAWTDTGTTAQRFPPVGAPGLSVQAEDDGTVRVTDTRTGEERWRVVVRAPVVVAPLLAGGLVLVAGSDKSLLAVDAATGATRWGVHFPDVLSAAPLAASDHVVVPLEDQTVRGLRLQDGREVWRVDTAGLVRQPPALAGVGAVVADQDGNLVALRVADGGAAWSASLDGPLSAGPVASNGLVVVADAGGTISGFDAGSGGTRWRAYTDGSIDVSPAIADGRVILVESLVRRLTEVDARDGSRGWSVHLDADVSAPPVVLGDEVVVATSKAVLRRFALADGRESPSVRLPSPTPSVSPEAPSAMNWFDGTLVVPEYLRSPWVERSYVVAFPAPAANSDTGPDGVGFEARIWRLPGLSRLVAPPVLLEGSAIVSELDQGGTVYRVGHTGATPLLRSPKSIAFTVRAGDLLLVEKESVLVALPLSGGEPRWTFPMDVNQPGTGPAVSEGVVVVPETTGLVGLDLQTGRNLWTWAPKVANGVGTLTPEVLPDGDIAYASGSLVRLDPRTGIPRWEIQDVDSFGSLASLDGRIFVSGFLQRETALVMAFDAGTGTAVWVQPFNPAVITGVAAADGVVVVPNRAGTVSAYDAATGTPKWSTTTVAGLVGTPSISGGRVTLVEAGRTEDAYSREYRVVVLDLQSGRYLGSYEPSGSAGTVTGGMGADGDRILVGSQTLGTSGVQDLLMVTRP
jgi:outer membrane protein assembly factor BamB